MDPQAAGHSQGKHQPKLTREPSIPTSRGRPNPIRSWSARVPPELLQQLCAEAGFNQFRTHDFDEPAHLYYEVRI